MSVLSMSSSPKLPQAIFAVLRSSKTAQSRLYNVGRLPIKVQRLAATSALRFLPSSPLMKLVCRSQLLLHLSHLSPQLLNELHIVNIHISDRNEPSLHDINALMGLIALPSVAVAVTFS
jgi:hypothetical protein